MARARKSHEAGEEKAKSSRTKLKSAYSAKVGGNHLVVYADLQRETDPYARVLVLNFAAEYAARYMIDLLIHNEEWEWVEPLGTRKAIRTTSGVRISMFGDDLPMLLDYKMSVEEQGWSDDIVKQNVLRFKYGVHEASKRADDNKELEDGTGETLSDGGTKKRKSKRGEPRTSKEPKVKIDKSGYVSANDIAKELKVEGREVRGVLRGLGLTKPDIGWAWPKESKELKDIRAKVEKGLKAPKKKSKK